MKPWWWSPARGHVSKYMFLYVYSESHLPNIFFFFFLNLFLLVMSSVAGEQNLVTSSCGSLLFGTLSFMYLSFVLEGEHHQTSIKDHPKTRVVQEHSIRPLCFDASFAFGMSVRLPLLLPPPRPIDQPSAGGCLQLSLLLGSGNDSSLVLEILTFCVSARLLTPD